MTGRQMRGQRNAAQGNGVAIMQDTINLGWSPAEL
jgi:hypothetical protein